jgi:hypothetical protein
VHVAVRNVEQKKIRLVDRVIPDVLEAMSKRLGLLEYLTFRCDRDRHVPLLCGTRYSEKAWCATFHVLLSVWPTVEEGCVISVGLSRMDPGSGFANRVSDWQARVFEGCNIDKQSIKRLNKDPGRRRDGERPGIAGD